MVDVQLVFDTLDYCDEKPEIPLPDEDPLEDGRIITRDNFFLLPVIVGKQNDGKIETRLPDHLCKPDDMHILDMERGNDQVECIG